MSVFADIDILNLAEDFPDLIDPFIADRIQPASYELTLGVGFKFMRESPGDFPLDVTDKTSAAEAYFEESPDSGDNYFLYPGDFALVTTAETVHIPDHVVAHVEGKSSLARLGLMVHVTAGWVDPGFHGQITLEVVNLSPRTLLLPIGMKLAQLAFDNMTGPAARPYGTPGLGSRYQGQSGVGVSQAVDYIDAYLSVAD